MHKILERDREQGCKGRIRLVENRNTSEKESLYAAYAIKYLTEHTVFTDKRLLRSKLLVTSTKNKGKINSLTKIIFEDLRFSTSFSRISETTQFQCFIPSNRYRSFIMFVRIAQKFL